jgi:hypothetical protein
MASCRKAERSVLDHDDWTLVASTHHPEVKALSDEDLAAARNRLRDLRDKQRDLGRETRRAARGKGEPRGGSFPGTYAAPRRRKQVFSHALRRLNDESTRRQAAASRATIVESQKRALAARRAAKSHRPANSPTASTGVTAIASSKRSTKVPGAKVGSVSQQGKRAQAKKDG